MIFAQLLEIVALSDLASVLCARKLHLTPRGIYLPPRDLSIVRLLNPEIWTRFWVIFCTCNEMDFIIVLIFGSKSICTLSSLLLSANLTFNVTFHEPYYKRYKN